MSLQTELAEIERLLPAILDDVHDHKGERLLEREAHSVPLLPEASRLIAQMTAAGVLRDIARVLGEVQAAEKPRPNGEEPDWNRVSQAVAVTAMRHAGQALSRSFRARRAAREEGS